MQTHILRDLMLMGNYFYSGSNSFDNSKNNREYSIYVPDPNDINNQIEQKYFTNSNSRSDDENDNHSINTDFDIEIDSTFLINISPSFVLNKRKGSFSRTEETLDENKTLTNNFSSNSYTEATAKNFKNTIDITKRFGKKGSFIKTSITNQIDRSDSEQQFNSTREIFGDTPSTDIRNQQSSTEEKFNSIQTRLTYRFPLIAKKFFLDTKYSYQNNKRENEENTFDFNTTTQSFSDFNADLSSNFTYKDISKTPTMELIYQEKKWRFNFELGMVNRSLENVDELRPELSLKRSFDNLMVDAGFRYRFNSKASIYFDYRINNNAPSLRQLQPFADISNPNNIITGNPTLKPSQRHRAYINFHKFNWQSGTGLFFYLSGGINNNQIVPSTNIDENFIRTTTYVNADGSYDLWGSATYSKKIKLDSLSSIKFRLGARTNISKNFNFLNNIKNITKTTGATPSIGITYDWNKIINIEPRYEITFSNTSFDNSLSQNQNFTRHTLRIRTKTNVPKKLEWRNDVSYSYNPNVIGFNKSAWFWNATLAYSVFKDKGSITLKAFDLLNQNNNVRRTASLNYIEDSESTVLQQYFMLGFSWKFNSLGKKGNIREFNFHF